MLFNKFNICLQFGNNFYFSAQYFAAEQLFLFYVMVGSYFVWMLSHIHVEVMGGVDTAEQFIAHIKLTR